MQLTKHFGCLWALAFATATAFAGDAVTPNWFDANVGATLGNDWSGSKGGAYWTFADNVGKLNNMSATGENEYLTYTATSAKSLPGDESTIRTEVKFTAMDKADFFKNGAVPAIPDDAKGGLTIIEDSDANPTTKFYGIVNGAWVALVGDTTAALSGRVVVEVKIWENNGKHISYKVGGQELKLTSGGSDALEASFTGDTISSVSYKGVCELASLQGDAQDELWTMTLQTIAAVESAIVELESGKQVKDIKFDSECKAIVQVPAKDLPKSITFAPAPDLWFFEGDKKGEKTKTVEVTTGIKGDGEIAKPADFANVTISTPVATLDGDNYASLGAAIKAVEAANKEVVLAVERTEDVSTENSYGFVLNLGAKKLTGSVTAASGAGEIKIVNGEIVGNVTANNQAGIVFAKRDGDGDIKVNGTLTGTFSADTGYYSMTPAKIKPICADGFFADATGAEPYATKVVEGEVVEDEDIPAVKLDPEELAKISGDKATYLKETSTVTGVPRWANLALGFKMDPGEGDDKPQIGVASDMGAADAIKIDNNFAEGKATIKIDGDVKSEVTLDSSKSIETHTVTVEVGGKVAMTTTIGANKITPAQGVRTMISVPWVADNNGGKMTLGELFKDATLSNGDKVEIYDAAKDAYVTKVWNGTAWGEPTAPAKAKSPLLLGANNDASAAEDLEFARGDAVWFTAAGENAVVYQAGTQGAANPSTEIAANEWKLVANPQSGTAKALSTIIVNPAEGTKIQTMDAKGDATVYTCKDGKWGYDSYVDVTKTIRGTETTVRKYSYVEIEDLTIEPGVGFWIMNAGKTAAIQW